MDRLPDEILLHITRLLEPPDIVRLQLVCTRFLVVARDSNSWKTICFINSRAEALRRRQQLTTAQAPSLVALRRAVGELPDAIAAGSGTTSGEVHNGRAPDAEMDLYTKAAAEHRRAMANWDPAYPGEKINFYEEYAHRHAPITASWLQPAVDEKHKARQEREVTGFGTLTVGEEDSVVKVVGALDDGSVCFWDVAPASNRKRKDKREGAIIVRSAPGILSGTNSSTKNDVNLEHSQRVMTQTGIVDCVSIDSAQQKGYFAVKYSLNEVDLQTLQVLRRTQFPFHITALSEARHPTPLTVGTHLTLHLHDPRAPLHQSQADQPRTLLSDSSTTCELISGSTTHSLPSTPLLRSPKTYRSDFSRLLTGDPPSSPFYSPRTLCKHASLSEPGPLSILHLPLLSTPSKWDSNGDIWVAGRFTSILNYSRRFFPRLRGTIHSGARLSSLTSLPFPYLAKETTLTQQHGGGLSLAEIGQVKNIPGRTIVAAGEYKTKGSLELYGLSSDPEYSTLSSDPMAARFGGRRTVYQNRQTAAKSKILAVAAHGARIVFSDGDGGLKWMERDGKTVVREWNLNSALAGNVTEGRTNSQARIRSGGNGFDAERGQQREGEPENARQGLFRVEEKGDFVQKIIPTKGSSYPSTAPSSPRTNHDDLVLWTADGKLALLGFGRTPAFDFRSEEEEEEEYCYDAGGRARGGSKGQERVYLGQMRRVLERMGDEARFFRGLGL